MDIRLTPTVVYALIIGARYKVGLEPAREIIQATGSRNLEHLLQRPDKFEQAAEGAVRLLHSYDEPQP